MSINFTINGKLYSVKLQDHPPTLTLNTYIRDYANLTGTKFMCLEGGCGACIVTIRGRHPVTRKYHGWAANSCLTLLNICDGWDIITVEGIGSKLTGYHPIQERLAHSNGSQCGYCSPGMIMNMHGLLEAKGGSVSITEVENSFGGNLCRCTGYRPILDAMKSFARDSEFEFIDLCKDIEDLGRECPRVGKFCPEVCRKPKTCVTYDDGHIWYFPKNLQEVFNALQDIGDRNYILVAGNTGHGVYRRDESIRTFIDVNYVPELHTNNIDLTLDLGGNITLTDAMEILTQASNHVGFEYCTKLVDHLDKVANVPVRNMGTIAGNLMLKYEHHEFPSDVFLLLTGIGAHVCIARTTTECVLLSLPEFLNYHMHKAVILKVCLPAIYKDNAYLETYKITPRAQNAHAYVNAVFFLRTSEHIVVDANVCFGGINPQFIQATATSRYLLGKPWISNDILQQSMQILSIEIKPDWILPDTSPAFRKLLACGLFYKFVLKYAPSNLVLAQYQSGGYLIERPLSSGTQVYETKKENWPLTKPVIKLEALNQCSGEAVYMNDLPPLPGQLWGAFVHALEAAASVVQIDPSEALKIPGVVAFYSAKDIPGKNSFVTVGLFGIVEDEEVFCSGKVKYHSQPVGVIVAETLDLAKLASTKVKIVYEHPQNSVLCTLKDVLISDRTHTKERFKGGPCTEVAIKDIPLPSGPGVNKVKGHFELGAQYHFSMETQTAVCIPDENEITLYSSNHFVDLVHTAVANSLKISENHINFVVRRLGGSYGAKLSRSGQVAIACALASTKLHRPVRFVQGLESNMATVGKRNACICDYNVDVDSKGMILKFAINYFEDFGCSKNDDPMVFFTTPFLPNCYRNIGWVIKGEAVLTDAPSHTWCRAPGSLEGIAMIENIMEHIARVVNRDPVDVRMDNIPGGSKMKELLPQFIGSTSYRSRKAEINKFNKANRWRKKGISISLMKYPINHFGSFPATVVVYHYDGTVAVSHGGIEVGQGLNTKVAQVAAHTLGIPLSMVTVKPTNNFNGANSFVTGGSLASESVCAAVKGACDTILERMKVAKSQLKNPQWVDITRKCYELNISLIANHLYKMGDIRSYDVWGLACAEVEVDILTGNFQLNRVDILEDTGESISPLIDVGQIEGAYIMGVGYWLTEHLIYDRRNGELLTNRTWNYKVPGAKDIPVDFRITLYQKGPNPNGFLRSKTTGEPAICLAIGTVFAIRHALDSARSDMKLNNWYILGAPTTPENVLLAASHDTSNFALQ